MCNPEHGAVNSLPSSFLVFIRWNFLLYISNSLDNPVVVLKAMDLSKQLDVRSLAGSGQLYQWFFEHKVVIFSKADAGPLQHLSWLIKVSYILSISNLTASFS